MNMTLDHLDPQGFPRYWKWFVGLNIIGLTTETFASLGFFILLQRHPIISGGAEHLTGNEILIVSGLTIPVLVIFGFLQTGGAWSTLFRYVVRRISPTQLKNPGDMRNWRPPSADDTITILKKVRSTTTIMAWSVVGIYLLWGLMAYGLYGDKMSKALIVCCTATGLVVSRLYYYRLQGFDAEPLVTRPARETTVYAAAVNQAFRDVDTKKIEEYRSKFRHSRKAHHLRVILSWLILKLGIVEKTEFKRKREIDARDAKSQYVPGAEEIGRYHVQALMRFALLIGLIVFTANRFHEFRDEADSLFDSRAILITYVAMAVLAAVVMDVHRFFVKTAFSGSESRAVLVCEEAFEIRSKRDVQNKEEAIFAKYDEKTDLVRQHIFVAHMAPKVIRTCVGMEEKFSLAFIDIDSFGLVNDILGYTNADRVLRAVAGILKDSFRGSSNDPLGRFGGEEFVALLDDLDVEKSAELLEKRVRSRIEGAFVVERQLKEGASDEDAREFEYYFTLGDGRKHRLEHPPSSKALKQVRAKLKEREIATYNVPFAEDLLTAKLGTVWSITVSVGIVGHTAIEGPCGKGVDPSTSLADIADRSGSYKRYESACEKLIESAGECAKFAKDQGRDVVAVQEGAERRYRIFTLPDADAEQGGGTVHPT